jgi:hypothetical protein
MKQRAFGPLNFHATLDKCAAERSRKEIEMVSTYRVMKSRKRFPNKQTWRA